MPLKNCIICSRQYYAKPSRFAKSNYCSRRCQRIGYTGKKILPFTEEHKNKIRLALKGRIFTENHRKMLSLSMTGRKQDAEVIAKRVAKNTGQKRTQEEKIRMSISAKNGKTGKHGNWLKGCQCHTWKGGITPLNEKIRHSREYKFWRKSVFERDNFTCLLCNKRSKKGDAVYLQADHIKSFAFYPELRFDINNGRTLCIECHKKTDTYGNKKH